jgi:hypothetical protein
MEYAAGRQVVSSVAVHNWVYACAVPTLLRLAQINMAAAALELPAACSMVGRDRGKHRLTGAAGVPPVE